MADFDLNDILNCDLSDIFPTENDFVFDGGSCKPEPTLIVDPAHYLHHTQAHHQAYPHPHHPEAYPHAHHQAYPQAHHKAYPQAHHQAYPQAHHAPDGRELLEVHPSAVATSPATPAASSSSPLPCCPAPPAPKAPTAPKKSDRPALDPHTFAPLIPDGYALVPVAHIPAEVMAACRDVIVLPSDEATALQIIEKLSVGGAKTSKRKLAEAMELKPESPGSQGEDVDGASAPKFRRYSKALPSRFCHVCARHVDNGTMMSCHNIAYGVCRKVVCSRCFDENGWDWESAKKGKFVCCHCKGECPSKAQCNTYKKTNRKRSISGIVKRKMLEEIVNSGIHDSVDLS